MANCVGRATLDQARGCARVELLSISTWPQIDSDETQIRNILMLICENLWPILLLLGVAGAPPSIGRSE
jgi:hypothetical protein